MSVDITSKKVFVFNKVPQSGITYMKEKGLIVEQNDEEDILDRKTLFEKVKGLKNKKIFQ